MTLSRDELEKPSKYTVRPQQWMETTDTSSRWSTGTFCHVLFTILNHMKKHQTPSLDKGSATESKEDCGLHKKVWILRKKPDLFWYILFRFIYNFVRWMRVTHNRRWDRITLHLSSLPDRKRHTADNKTGGSDPRKCYKWTWLHTWSTHVNRRN